MGYKGFIFLCLLLAVAAEVLVISSVEVTARDLTEITSSNQENAAGQVEQTNVAVDDSEGRGGGPWEGGGGPGRGGPGEGPWEGGGGPGGWGGRGGGPWEGGGGPGGWGGRGGGPWEGGGGPGGGGPGGGCRWGCCGGGWRCRCCTYAEAFKNRN